MKRPCDCSRFLCSVRWSTRLRHLMNQVCGPWGCNCQLEPWNRRELTWYERIRGVKR